VRQSDLHGRLSGIGERMQAQGSAETGTPKTVLDLPSDDIDTLGQPSSRPRQEYGDKPSGYSRSYSADNLSEDDLWSMENINPLVEDNNHSPNYRASVLDELEGIFGDDLPFKRR
jgi:hypothetical protein